MKGATWTTREGVTIRIRDMEDRHLLNTIRMLERMTEKARQDAINTGYAVLSTLQGEMATYSVEQELDHLESGETDTEDFFPAYPKLVKEAKRRRLL